MEEILKELKDICYKRFTQKGLKKEYPASEGSPRYKYLYYDLQDDLYKLVEKLKPKCSRCGREIAKEELYTGYFHKECYEVEFEVEVKEKRRNE